MNTIRVGVIGLNWGKFSVVAGEAAERVQASAGQKISIRPATLHDAAGSFDIVLIHDGTIHPARIQAFPTIESLHFEEAVCTIRDALSQAIRGVVLERVLPH